MHYRLMTRFQFLAFEYRIRFSITLVVMEIFSPKHHQFLYNSTDFFIFSVYLTDRIFPDFPDTAFTDVN